MYTTLKIFVFGIYSLAVFFFSHYLRISHSINAYNDWFFADENIDNKFYDFIVVGAGSAGVTLTSELLKSGNKVLLIEAGASPAPFSNIPIFGSMLQGSPYDWQYKTVAQKNACKGLLNNTSIWPQGKVLGGSSRLNYMAYVTGHPKDYEKWFPDFEEYKFRETDRVLNEPKWSTYISDIILDGIKEKLSNTKNDFSKVKLTMENGERWSTDKLLELQKPNDRLGVITHALVEKLIFADDDSVEGVEFTKWGKKFKVTADNGVIVSAGAIGSPKLLMLSGIGPKNHLESLEINVINDLPVGENLVDHITTGLDLVTINDTLPLSIQRILSPLSALNYLLYREGPWTSAGIEAQGTFYVSSQNNDNEAPAVQLMIIPAGISQDNGIFLRKAIGISDKLFHEYFGPLILKNAITIAPVLLHPKSSGRVRLASVDPQDDPIIDPNYLSHPEDVSTLITGLRFVEQLVNSEAMKKLDAEIYKKPFPGCENFVFDSSEYWECYVRHLTLTSYHPAGTCRMGNVVDRSFRVFNTKNLYVVDASVLPKLPSGNTNAAVMMLAKKAAKLLDSQRRKRVISDKRSKTCGKLDVFLSLTNGKQSDIRYCKMRR